MESIPEKLAVSVVVVQLLSHVWLCNPMDCSTPGFSVSHNLWKFVQVHVHWIGDAIQPSHPLSPSSPPAPNLSQHQGLSQRVGSLHQGAKALELQLLRQPFQWMFRVDFFRIDWFDLLAVQRTLQESSPAPQFKSVNSSALSLLYGPALTYVHDYRKAITLTYGPLSAKICLVKVMVFPSGHVWIW